MTDVVITGMGLVTGLARGVDPFLDRLRAGDRALPPAPPCGGGPSRESLLRAALDEAAIASGLRHLPDDCLVVTVAQTPAVTAHGPEVAEFASPFATHPPGVPEQARVTCLSQACASIAAAIALSRMWLRTGRFTLAVVAGAFTPSRYDRAGMSAIGCLSQSAARPFDIDRDGTSLGAGAGAIILEGANTAAARDAHPLAVVAGVSVVVHPHGSGSATMPDVAAGCIRAALADAGDPPIDYVHAHATGTRQGDAAELAALEQVGAAQGWRGVPVGADKGAVGHLMHASGAPGIATALGVLRDGVVPGLPGLNRPERTTAALDLQAASHCRDPARVAVVNSFGFGGNNAVLVLAAGEPDRRRAMQ